LRVLSPNDAELGYRCSHYLWRLRRIALPGTALVAIFSRASAHGPVGGLADEGGRGGARHRRQRTCDRLARPSVRRPPCISLFSWQRRFAALARRALSRSYC